MQVITHAALASLFTQGLAVQVEEQMDPLVTLFIQLKLSTLFNALLFKIGLASTLQI